MKILRISDLFGWILIGAGLLILGGLVYRNVKPYLPEKVKTLISSKHLRLKPKAKPKPKPTTKPVKTSKQLLKVKEYLKKTNTQLVEGFAAIDFASSSGGRRAWHGAAEAWWEDSGKKDQKVVWRSAECPQKKPTTLVFSGMLGKAPGEARLSVNDKAVLVFNTGPGSGIEEWKNKDFRLKCFAMEITRLQERIGIFCLAIPEDEVTAGKPMKLEVSSFKETWQGISSCFLLSGMTDTLDKLDLK